MLKNKTKILGKKYIYIKGCAFKAQHINNYKFMQHLGSFIFIKGILH